jgi:hypothetical protein
MNKYKVITTMTTHFEEVIQASSEEEARELYQVMMSEETTNNTEVPYLGEFYINEIFLEE